MSQGLRKKLPIEVLLRWHNQTRRHARRAAPPNPEYFASPGMLRRFLQVPGSKDWRNLLTSAGIATRRRGGFTRAECELVMLKHFTRRGEMLVKKWELAERQVGTFRKQ